MKTVVIRAWVLALLGVGAAGCPDPQPPEPRVPDDILGALGEVMPAATAEQRATFERGRQVALRRFTRAEGLGPHFNVVSCAGCHEKPVTGGSAGRYRNFLLVGQRLPDGSFVNTGTNGVQPHYGLLPARNPTDPDTNLLATRNPIAFFGVGLLAELPDASILRYADPEDANGDGISGRPNYDRGFVGRFGRKAQTVSIEGFIRGPLFNHLGITSNPLPDALKARLPVPSSTGGVRGQPLTEAGLRTVRQAQAAAPDEPTIDFDGVPDPELSEQDLFDVVSFSMLTAAPRPDAPTPGTEEGRALFAELGCTGCHVPTLEGPRGLIPAYSDLLLHDMGPELADGVVMKEASGSEFRTQPLWGISAVGPYLHDGRADTLEHAIRLHGGEASRSREAYLALEPAGRERVLGFLESLGGREQRTAGLLPPGAAVPSVGEWGGPAQALSPHEAARFLTGQRLFDRDFGLSEGVGPRFNGDSCRACHFDPVIGGAGPLDVDVLRQGIIRGDTVDSPAMGTMAHRHGALAERPPVDPAADLFERRQTPPLFGLGLIERIPEALVLAREDPQDSNGDGIRGRAHRLVDGRLGRFGWKANVPSVHEFLRDALSNELGLTVPMEQGFTFGVARDADVAVDPEIPLELMETMSFYLSRLGPPPRTRVDPAREEVGRGIFEQVGCSRCHVASLVTEDGVEVPLYSDLLLHDVTQGSRYGVAEGAAGPRELRTPPLWGLARTAPYLHDGAAATVEEAIALHGGEAQAVREAYGRLSPEERAALGAFLRSL
jgi:CxxC motif-containing protein (DUF1111 family)